MTNNQASADHPLTTSVPEAFAWAPDMVVYHDKCADGIVAAWACWKRWPEADYRAANYGHQPPSDIAGKHILIVDFSWPADELREMVAAGANSIVILDHHKTAQAALEPFAVASTAVGWYDHTDVDGLLTTHHWLAQADEGDQQVLAFFDMDRSGARMSWHFAHPGEETPLVVELAETYDLWRFEPGQEEPAELMHLALQADGLSIASVEVIDWHLSRLKPEPLTRGLAISRWKGQLVEEIASRAHLRTVAGIEGVIAVECPYSLVSAVGHRLLNKHPAAPFAAMSVTGEHAVTWSLRSRDDRADASEVAKSMGGGGHRNAAGFRVDLAGAKVSQGEALKFLDEAIRNWVGVDPLSSEDVADVAAALSTFLKRRAA